MTRGAFPGTIEIGFTLLGVAGLQISHVDAATAAGLGVHFSRLVAKEGDHFVDLREGEPGKRRHAFLGSSVVDRRANSVSSNVAGHETRSREVGTGFAAVGFAAVTERAVARKNFFAALWFGVRAWFGCLC